MGAKRGFNLAIILAVAVILSLFIFFQETKKSYTEKILEPSLPKECLPYQRTECISAEGYKGFKVCEDGKFSSCFIASLNECPLKPDQLAAVCCKSKDGNLYDCNDKKDFKPGEYVIIKANLQMAMTSSGINMESYKACSFSGLASADTKVPENYQGSTAFSDGQSDVACSNLFYSKDFHHGVVDGFVPNTKGKMKLAEWRIYPSSMRLSTASEALSNIDTSSSVFAFEVNIIG